MVGNPGSVPGGGGQGTEGKQGCRPGPRGRRGGGRGGGSPNSRSRTRCWRFTSPQEPTHTRVPAADSEALSTYRMLRPALDCTAPRLVSRPRHTTEAALPSAQVMRQVKFRDSPTAIATWLSGGSTSSSPPAGNRGLSSALLLPGPYVGFPITSPTSARASAAPPRSPRPGWSSPRRRGSRRARPRSMLGQALSLARGGGGLNSGVPGSFPPPRDPATPLPLFQLLPGGFPRGFPTLTPDDPGGDRGEGAGGERCGGTVGERPKSEQEGRRPGPVPGLAFRNATSEDGGRRGLTVQGPGPGLAPGSRRRGTLGLYYPERPHGGDGEQSPGSWGGRAGVLLRWISRRSVLTERGRSPRGEDVVGWWGLLGVMGLRPTMPRTPHYPPLSLSPVRLMGRQDGSPGPRSVFRGDAWEGTHSNHQPGPRSSCPQRLNPSALSVV